MMQPISFFVPGTPKAQPRQKAYARNGHAGTYTPSTAEEWKARIRKVAALNLPTEPLSSPIRVDITFYFPRPKNHCRSNGQLKDNSPKWHTSKPDRDNSDKAVLDLS